MLVIFSVIMAVAYAMLDERRPTDCPAAGFVTYENRRVLLRNQFLTFTRVGGIDDCYRECISRSECGFFEITVAGFCTMFTPEFRESNLILSFIFKVGVPCEKIQNPTEASTTAPTETPTEASTTTPTETPTEASTATPTDAPTEASTATPTGVLTLAPEGPTAAPNDCPTEGYLNFPGRRVSSSVRSLAFFRLDQQRVDVNDFCNAQCNSFSGCGLFQVSDGNFCTISRAQFDESLLLSDSGTFVGVPCCPVQGYFIYSGKAIHSSDLILDIVELGPDGGGDNCNAECSLRPQCGYFHVEDSNCVMFRGPFHSSLLLSDAAVFVGVPCEGIENPTEDPNEVPTETLTEVSTATPTSTPPLAPTGPIAPPDECPAEGYFRYPQRRVVGGTGVVFIASFLGLTGQDIDVNDFCNAACSSDSDCVFFSIGTSLTSPNSCVTFRGVFDESELSSGFDRLVGVPCCPVQGYVIYSGYAIRSPDLILDIVELGQEEGGDNCNSECSLRPQCGYFHVADNNCVMFIGSFRRGLLSRDAEAFVGVPCSF